MSRPFATLALAGGLLAGYTLELAHGGARACQTYGFVPARASFETALSSLFLHDPSSVLHLGGNLVFLVVFGVIVEGALGSLALLALFAAAGLGGAGVHLLVDPSSTTPLVGASGAIFGVLAVAGILRPRLLGFVLAFAGINILWAFWGGAGDVSFGCHIGGFLVGAIAVGAIRVFDAEALELVQ